MPKLVAPLTETQVKNAKPKATAYKLSDGDGLYLEITPTGSKLWRMKYRRPNKKENRLSFGSYPEVTLAKAREKRAEARKLIADGIDPADHRDALKASKATAYANSFEAVAREWLTKNKDGWAKSHHDKILGRFEKDVFPFIGEKPISSLAAPEMRQITARIEKRGVLETAYRVQANCSQVFRYAVATGRAERDPMGDLRGSLPSLKSRRSHFASITDPKEIGPLLRALDSYKGSPAVEAALKLAPLVFVRPGELRAAEWADIDFEAAEWRYLVTKTKTPHIVPLSSQAIAILRELHPITGRGTYLFPNPRSADRPMSDNAVLSAMRRMGISGEQMSGHGFRAMARTVLDEVLGFRPDFIEHQLAHAVRDPNGFAYNRTSHLAERKKMMQTWADYLDSLKSGSSVVTGIFGKVA